MGATIGVRKNISRREGVNQLHRFFLGFLLLFLGAFAAGAAQLVVVRQGGESVSKSFLDELGAVLGHQLGGIGREVVRWVYFLLQ